MPALPTRKTYRFGYNGEDVVTQTFCSSTAETVAIAAHFLNNGEDSRLSV